ncbi:peptidoglycan-binding protein [Actinophytocola sp.]|uniref:peptidoglycan-binding protein n=1 Tax=Actinophytocola sp. TaxID=1872138 RepID=UPI0025B95BCD|nr:peptidoglycan-binding protein [Actinophytocola sp.]
MAKSQNGFPASANRAEIDVRVFPVNGTAVKLPVRADVAPRLVEMAHWFHVHVEPLRAGECHGYAFRPIEGSTVLSNHASGTAIDLNAPSHPMGKHGTVPAAKRAAISAKARELGLRWGGDFTGRVDEMHFEVLANGHQPATRPTIKRGARGDAVREAQGILNRKQSAGLAVDGIFGPLTDKAVREFQRRGGLEVDGIVGPKTWGRLLA